ncbi:MAG: cysteine hydrolase [Planctomyces sp.]|nr:cysteine hydrolase [Planctomyces sp.]
MSKRALLVIDVQMEYFNGALPISWPDGHLNNILRAMDAAHEKGIPVAVIRHHQPDPDSPIFRLNSPQWQLHPEVEKRERTILIEKQFPGSFTGTPLESWLKEHKIDTVVIAGYMTHMCCDTTARQACHLGYKVEFLSDATGTLPVENSAGRATGEELQRSILVAQQMFLSEVLSSADWLQRISKS